MSKLALLQPNADFLCGANIPWKSYGNDFTGRWNIPFDYKFWDDTFQKLSDAKGNVARLWLFGRGETLNWDAGNHPDFFDADLVISNVKSMLNIADKKGIKVIPVFLDFHIADNYDPYDKDCDKRLSIFKDDQRMGNFIQNIVKPIINGVRGDPMANNAVLAWDICNEAEWLSKDVKPEDRRQTVSLDRVQRFVGKVAAAIHQVDSEALVTVGGGTLKYNNHNNSSAGGEFLWSDYKLQKEANWDYQAKIDVVQAHLYEYMIINGSNDADRVQNPLAAGNGADSGFDGKPVILGEVAGNMEVSHKDYTPPVMIARAINKKYCGILFWCMYAEIANAGSKEDRGKWDNFQSHLQVGRWNKIGGYISNM
eukprot:jgi/Botrbrau1/6774/Bobra.0057s0010.1